MRIPGVGGEVRDVVTHEKYVVIGSHSFSGSDFVDRLLEEGLSQIWGVSRSREPHPLFLPYRKRNLDRFRFHQMDLNHDLDRILALIDEVRPDYVVNFAAQSEVAPSWDHPVDYYRTNALSVVRLAHALRGCDFVKRYVHISSPEVLGVCEGVAEDAPVHPTTPYAASKASADLYLQALSSATGFPVTLVRSTNVYGRHQRLHKIIPRTVIALREGRTVALHGGGDAVKSFIHIRDISEGELGICRLGRAGEIYHLSPQAGLRVCDVVRRICELRGADFNAVTRHSSERAAQDRAYVIDSTKARKELGWAPRIGLDEGLRDVFDWVDGNWDVIQTLPMEYTHRP